MHVLKECWDVVISLLKGLLITLKQMFSKPCTIQYPEERLIWPERNRGRVVLPIDPTTGKNRCTLCMMCQRTCPNGSIEIEFRQNAENKRELADWVYHLEQCTFCGLCVEVCPFDALRMSHEHEIAVWDRKELVRHLQSEQMAFNPEWQGGLLAKPDKPKPASTAAAEAAE